jgi:hypothetical protein
VSGLVSRTVLNRELLRTEQFHGAKYYAALHPTDVSAEFLDAVSAHFGAVREEVQARAIVLQNSDRTPAWSGWAAVERISAAYGIGDVNLVKPGIGETTRVLLRRVPERVLIRERPDDDLAHVLLLAAQRGVPVDPEPGLPYSCVGIVRPRR